MTEVNNNVRYPNYAGALGTAVVGGAAWGACEYLFHKKPFLTNETLSDAFVKSMEEGFVALKDTATIEKVDALKDLEKNIDDLKTVDELKEFFNKQKDDLVKLTDDELKLIGDDLAKMELEKGKNSLKRLMKTEGKYSQYFKEAFDSCCNEAGKLVHDATKISKEKFDVVKNAANKARLNNSLKAAGIFVGICGLCSCLSEFFLSRKQTKKS